MNKLSTTKSRFLIRMFSFLSSCGFREKLVSFAFQPPKISYTLRLVDKDLRPIYRDQVCRSQSEKFCDIDDIRQHRISCDTLLVQQSYKLDTIRETEQVLEKNVEQTRVFSTAIRSIAQVEQGEQLQIVEVELYYQPKNIEKYPLHQLFLLDQNEKPIDIGNQVNVNISGYILESSKGNKIASVFFEIQKTKVEYCMIFSHGNAADLGYMLDTYLDLAYNLNINVFAYEYSGYGQSSGRCTDIHIIQDIKCAYKFLIDEMGFEPTKIIIYGYSIGSGPSVALTSLDSYPVGGLIIHSGISSGLRVIDVELNKTPYYDFFPNVELIQNVSCPVYVLHGTNDLCIGIEHATLLAENCDRLYNLWSVEDAGHFGIDTENMYRKEYFKKMREFVRFVMKENKEIPRCVLEHRNRAKKRNDYEHYYTGMIGGLPVTEMSVKSYKTVELLRNPASLSE